MAAAANAPTIQRVGVTLEEAQNILGTEPIGTERYALANTIIQLHTANGINASVAKRVEPLSDALDIANEVIAALGGSKVEPDFSKIEGA